MWRLDRALRARGYHVLNLGYRSRAAAIDTLARDVAARVHAWDAWDAQLPVHFVTHSLGGIIVRAAVARGWLPRDRVGRVVMLGPPNSGSEVVDAFLRTPGVGRVYGWITGPAGRQLGTGPDSYMTQLPAVDFPLGVIAGSRSFNPLFSAILQEASDGKVRVARTRVVGMTDFIVVPQWHPLLPSATKVIRQVIHFLMSGSFDH